MGLSRSEQMARVKSRGTLPEKRLRQALHAAGVRYRLTDKRLRVRPDLVVCGEHRVAVFVDGCFWHGCPTHYLAPRSAIEFWGSKLVENVSRDRRQTLELEHAGWRVLRLWECEVIESLERCVRRVQRAAARAPLRPELDWRLVRVEWLDDDPSIETHWLEDLREATMCRMMRRRRTTLKARLRAR